MLYDSKRRFVWQNLDHPTDTLMVGQSLRVGGSAFDGNLGKYSLVMESDGLALYINGVTTNPLPYYYYSDGMFGIAERLTHVTFTSSPAIGNATSYELSLVTNSG